MKLIMNKNATSQRGEEKRDEKMSKFNYRTN